MKAKNFVKMFTFNMNKSFFMFSNKKKDLYGKKIIYLKKF